MSIPDYALKGVSKDISMSGEHVIRDANGDKISAVMKEIGDTPISMSDGEIINNGLSWLGNNTTGLSREAVESYDAEITPIVMSEINEDDSEGQEETVAYVLNYYNKYDGIRISGEGYDAVVDSEGVIAANAKWSEFEKVENVAKGIPVTYEQAKQLVKDESAARTSQDVETMKGDIAFVFNKDDGVYYPTWIFNGEETSYMVNCLTGEVK